MPYVGHMNALCGSYECLMWVISMAYKKHICHIIIHTYVTSSYQWHVRNTVMVRDSLFQGVLCGHVEYQCHIWVIYSINAHMRVIYSINATYGSYECLVRHTGMFFYCGYTIVFSIRVHTERHRETQRDTERHRETQREMLQCLLPVHA